jgi:rubrerythrin
MVRIAIHAVELTPLECEVLSEIMAAKLEQHIADRAKYVRKDSGAAAVAAAGNKVDAGQTTGPANPALSPRPDAIVAWDLTLRCPVCGSTVEGRRNDYHCYSCERAGR